MRLASDGMERHRTAIAVPATPIDSIGLGRAYDVFESVTTDLGFFGG
jgi:hypothetical protein